MAHRACLTNNEQRNNAQEKEDQGGLKGRKCPVCHSAEIDQWDSSLLLQEMDQTGEREGDKGKREGKNWEVGIGCQLTDPSKQIPWISPAHWLKQNLPQMFSEESFES